ncbi:SNAP25 homologous protein SNAP33-like [Cucurbita pepo subsp. pepo]|uniref:SNAP25 homologous protein SNAP33-like n=1 Tax=Cucurbita pepo subsp. pepo TaxID=3664 RepID=UPI000C9D5C4D|nr:SNAP25 homologous protein SNAP33-like [Cucurbita pepo subsp. pepo]XP_023523342.1 SNAP25 homologous protein SNAP33-like [Cucurbita pepo subsp. pepo]
MFGSRKAHLKIGRHSSTPNPFESDDGFKAKQNLVTSQRTSSDPSLVKESFISNPFDDDHGHAPSSSSSLTWSERNKYKNDFRDSGGLENQSVQELENYATYKAEETTKAVNGCLKIAEEIREDATQTLVALHQQGEQITRTHMVAADIDYDLSRGEKLLGNLGGIFSKTWKPKKTRPISGPIVNSDDLVRRKGSHLEQKEKLGLTHHKGRTNTKAAFAEPTNAIQKVEVEKVKQDDALSDMSNILEELKEMAVDMGCEIDRQIVALDHASVDVEVLGDRVKDASRRGRRLLGK